MRKLLYLTAIVAIAVLSLGFFTNSVRFQTGNSLLPSPATISIDELHRSIDMKALPVHQIQDPL